MIIQSKFHDYYDGFLSHETRDPKIVYKRETTQLPLKTIRGTKLGEYLRTTRFVAPMSQAKHVGLILLGGKLYPLGIYKNESTTKTNYQEPYHAFQLTQKEKKTRAAFNLEPKEEATWGQENPHALQLNQKIAPVIFLGEFHITFPKTHGYKLWNSVIANPPLNELNFPMDGHLVIQEIMATLNSQPSPTIEITDPYKAQAHGMDKTSFRRDKGGPTRKRKKVAKPCTN